MGLNGKYTAGASSAFVLNITTSDVSNGTFSGTFTANIGGTTYQTPVSGHYHYFNSTQDPTLLSFWGATGNDTGSPGTYVGYAGVTSQGSDFKTIDGNGGVAVTTGSGQPTSVAFGWLQKS